MSHDKHLRCSFCGKSKDSVRKFISGPSVYICNECIALCNEILAEDEEREVAEAITQVPTPAEIKDVLDQYVIGQDRAKKTLAVAVYNHYKRINSHSGRDNEVELDKSNILLIGGGAFDGLEKIIESRTGRRQIGFTKEEVAEGVAEKLKKNPFVDVEPDDLLRYGLIPELVGRLPVTVPLDALDEEALVRILTEPKNALAKQYQKLFDLEDVRLTLEKDALKAIAAKAMKRGTGARGLRAILEEMMTEIMFELPSRDDVREVAITAECVTSGRAPLLVTERPRQKKEA